MSSTDEVIIDRVEDRAAQRGFEKATAIYSPELRKLEKKSKKNKKERDKWKDACYARHLEIEELQQELTEARIQLETANCENVTLKKHLTAIRALLKVPSGWSDEEIVTFISERLRITRKKNKKEK